MGKENFMISQMQRIASITSGRQREFFNFKLQHAKEVAPVSIHDVFTTDEIERIMEEVRPKKKHCFKNATLMAQLFPDVVYVEGELGIAGVIGTEHAFNRRGDKYFDVTVEMCLGSDVTKESYISILEEDDKDALTWFNMDTKTYGAYIPYYYENFNNESHRRFKEAKRRVEEQLRLEEQG